MPRTQEPAVAKPSARTATFSSLLVHAEPGAVATHRVEIAARLARDLGARLIGLGAESFDPGFIADPFAGYAAGQWVTLVQEQITQNLKAAEVAFRRDAAGAGADFEWRTVQEQPARALARAARAADLIVMTPRGRGGPTRTADPAEVIMTAGRPVLLVPQSAQRLKGACVIVAWKDTREARRALADAMPFLLAAEDVVVQAVCKGDAVAAAAHQTEDVATGLQRHGVKARANVSTATHEGVTAELERIAALNNADLIVAGAYGHSRFAEWALGGVSDDLIHKPGCFVLMSH